LFQNTDFQKEAKELIPLNVSQKSTVEFESVYEKSGFSGEKKRD
jgi:hypothetical protein